ncbi:sugar kinase [Kovacikia minuta CCNUW1]|uniref:sugar kinase n=1 Tax=Kovacikia minuta TaxID=2931930 RepID=UPI001CCECB99|nr:sugar kinase [Kovacikia minuta]UBF26279.1 sugar kinase [Kovacikia minuta CCNUW1]
MLEGKRGLFVGLVTLDLVYLVEHFPTSNQKMVASDYTVSAGGPATNAAVAFNYMNGQATILGVLGKHAITHLILTDLQRMGVAIADLAPDHLESPAVSSIIVTEATGERAVISINAVNHQATEGAIPKDCLQDVAVVLVDGHQMEAGQAIAQQAKSQGIPVVIDGGSWKPGFDAVLQFADYAICSANFHPPGCKGIEDTVDYLTHLGVSHIAITCGEQPIRYWHHNQMGWIEVPRIKAVDTSGAGDIFHGTFCSAILQEDFVDALSSAARVATRSCQFFGTRRWMDEQ